MTSAASSGARYDLLEVPALSTRSILLSLLLGHEGEGLSSRDLVRIGRNFGVTENSVRVTLSRMVAAGDLQRTEAAYRLSPRLLARQIAQEQALHPSVRPWDGTWSVVVLADAAEDGAHRQRRRQTLQDQRLVQVRHGVWMRPANLDLLWPEDLRSAAVLMNATVEGEDADLALDLWDLHGWSRQARALIVALEREQPAQDTMAVAAAMVRLLRVDPLLPSALLPPDWAGSEVREQYARYRAGLIDRYAQEPTSIRR